MSEKYELIKGLGLSVSSYNGGLSQGTEFVYASDLESLLVKGVRVYSYGGQNGWFKSLNEGNYKEVQALLINIQPIPKLEPVSLDEVIRLLKSLKKFYAEPTDPDDAEKIGEFVERIKTSGVKW